MYGHALILTDLAPASQEGMALAQRVKDLHPETEHPDLHQLDHPKQVELWLRTTRFSQLCKRYGVDDSIPEKINMITTLAEEFKSAI